MLECAGHMPIEPRQHTLVRSKVCECLTQSSSSEDLSDLDEITQTLVENMNLFIDVFT